MESAELALVISDLGSGGAQRVLVTLANAWAEQGRRICVITLADESSVFFSLHPSVRRLVSGGMRESQNPFEAIWMNMKRIVGLRRRLRECGAPAVVSFVGTTNILTVLACLGFGRSCAYLGEERSFSTVARTFLGSRAPLCLSKGAQSNGQQQGGSRSPVEIRSRRKTCLRSQSSRHPHRDGIE